jgi:hypothetical protein
MSIDWRKVAAGGIVAVALLDLAACSTVSDGWNRATGGNSAPPTAAVGGSGASGGYLRPVMDGRPVTGTSALAPSPSSGGRDAPYMVPAGAVSTGAASARTASGAYMAPAGGSLGPNDGRPPVSGATAISDTLAGPTAVVTDRLAALGYDRTPTPAANAIPAPGERSQPTGYDRLVRAAYDAAPSVELDVFPGWSNTLRW